VCVVLRDVTIRQSSWVWQGILKWCLQIVRSRQAKCWKLVFFFWLNLKTGSLTLELLIFPARIFWFFLHGDFYFSCTKLLIFPARSFWLFLHRALDYSCTELLIFPARSFWFFVHPRRTSLLIRYFRKQRRSTDGKNPEFLVGRSKTFRIISKYKPCSFRNGSVEKEQNNKHSQTSTWTQKHIQIVVHARTHTHTKQTPPFQNTQTSRVAQTRRLRHKLRDRQTHPLTRTQYITKTSTHGRTHTHNRHPKSDTHTLTRARTSWHRHTIRIQRSVKVILIGTHLAVA